MLLVVSGVPEENEHLRKHISEQGQKLVDAEIVYLVPMFVQDVQASLEPLFLVLGFAHALHNFADFDWGFSLVNRFVRMPKHYKIKD